MATERDSALTEVINDGGGDIAYVGSRDDGAGQRPVEATNTVAVGFDGLFVDRDDDHDPDEDEDIGAWQAPCPNGGSLDVAVDNAQGTAIGTVHGVLQPGAAPARDMGGNVLRIEPLGMPIVRTCSGVAED